MSKTNYDAIIVGARLAGATTALLLARQGYRVLLLDRATFPSDTLSTHQLQVPGGARLKHWGLLDQVIAAPTPLASSVTFNVGSISLHGTFPPIDGVTGVYSPRRYILDTILVNAAQSAGAELRTAFHVDDLLSEDNRVVGIRGHHTNASGSGHSTFEERGRIVIGADGMRSLVARQVQAPAYNEHPTSTAAYYTYWENVPLTGGEIYSLPRRAVGVWPTNHGQVLAFLSLPREEFDTFRADVPANFMASMSLAPHLHERLMAGKQADRFYGTGDLPSFFRKPYGPGWALVGDAGLHKDPVSGQGMGDALRDAELLADALHTAWSNPSPDPQSAMATALTAYEQHRNAAALPSYEFTLQTASFTPFAPEQLALLEALTHNPEQATRFFGVVNGTLAFNDFLTPVNLIRLLGPRAFLRMAASRFANRSVTPTPQPTSVL